MAQSINALVTLQRGTTYQSALLGQPGPYLLGLASISRDGGFRYGNLKTYGGHSPEKLLLRPGDVYVSLKDVTQSGDVLGAVSRVPETISLGRLTQDTLKLIPRNQNVNMKYIYWILRTPEYRDYCRARAIGTTNLSLSREDFLGFQLPDLTNGHITFLDLLERIEQKIGLNCRLNETLEAMAQEIFKDWFVDFGPVRAKMEGRETHGISAEVAALFPTSLGEDGVPDGWRSGSLSEIAVSSRRPADPGALDPKTPYIGLEHMPRRSIALTEWENVGKVTSGKTEFNQGEFLFGKLRPYFHKVGIAPVNGVCSTDILVLKEKETEWSSFVLCLISSSEFVDYTDRTSRGTKMPRTNWTDMGNYSVTLPGLRLVSEFNAVVRPMTDRIVGNIHENRILAQLRDLLLSKLMADEIRVGKAEKVLDEAI